MRTGVILLTAWMLAWNATPQSFAASRQPHTHHKVGLILHDNVPLRATASTHAKTLAVLVQQTQVVLISRRKGWSHVKIWTAVDGWVPTSEVVYRKPWITTSTYRAPAVHVSIHAQTPQRLAADAVSLVSTPLVRAPGGAVTGRITPGTRIHVSAWQQDVSGAVWYSVDGSWANGSAIQFTWAADSAAGHARWKLVAGKGMWLTLGPIAESAPDSVVEAARRAGITHLYLESAISPLGFHGKGSIGPLIDAAHRRHIAIIAWVYPYLHDLAADVSLTRSVAAFQSASGEHLDGIAADLETNADLPRVRTYSQLVRAYVGPRFLLIGVTYPPQSSPQYPFAEVDHDYDVVAPMDYWHETRTGAGTDYGGMPYGSTYGYRYAIDSIRGLRRFGVHRPVAPIGQVFDDFGRLEMGPYAPSGTEIQGFLEGCKAGGAIGASFFQWMTATVEEWQAIRRFRY